MLFLQVIGEQHCGLPDGLAKICADPDSYTSSARHNIINLFVYMKLSDNQEGKLGKTPQFWMIYLELCKIKT